MGQAVRFENRLKAQAEWFESTPLLPQRDKSGSVPGFALLDLLEGLLSLFRAKRGIFFAPRNARSAFHTAFSPLCLRQSIHGFEHTCLRKE